MVEYVPSLLASDEDDKKIEGYLIFAGGPNLNELSIYYYNVYSTCI